MGKRLEPKLRFSKFEDEFTEYSFENIFSFSTGKNIKQSEASPEYQIPCVRYGELYHMYQEIITKVINKTNLDKSELKFSEGNEILLPSAGEDPLDIGSASALKIPNVAIGRTINILKPISEGIYSQNYVAYYINEKLRKKISTLAKGVSISNVYNSDLKKLKINLPPLPEQEKIASFLSSVDSKIEKLEKKRELLSQYKKGIMQKIFSQEIRFKDESGNEYPQWEEKKFKELVKLQRGSSPRPIVKYITTEDSGVNWIKIGDTSKDVALITSTSEKITKEGALKSRFVKTGEIILSNSMSFGRPYILGIDGYIHDGWFVIRKYEENFNKEYLCQILGSEVVQKQYKRLAAGGVVSNISSELVNAVKINLPCLEEQEKIANFLSSVDKKIEVVERETEKNKEFKKGLLQQMFV